MGSKSTIMINLWKNDNEITVNANFKFDTVINDTYKFNIADGYMIDQITDGKNEIEYDVFEEELEFRALTKRIEIAANELRELFISYHGNVKYWHTLYEDDILAINFYTAWYPIVSDFPVDYVIRIHLDDSFFVVNGQYNSEEKVWYYRPLDSDVNIIAMRNYELLQSENVSVFYYGKENYQAVLPYFDNYNQIVKYYTELYGNNRTDKTNIVLLPKGNKYDGYLRKSLIVFGGIREDYYDIVHHLAHEIAHSWCRGAKTDSWEDWQNETFAEWSALLYELEVTGNINKFNKVIAEKKKNFPTPQPLKSKNGNRPEGVHDNGVLHLHQLYCTYGKGIIKEILRTFDSLEIKTTENLIRKLKYSKGMEALSDYIADMVTCNE